MNALPVMHAQTLGGEDIPPDDFWNTARRLLAPGYAQAVEDVTPDALALALDRAYRELENPDAWCSGTFWMMDASCERVASRCLVGALADVAGDSDALCDALIGLLSGLLPYMAEVDPLSKLISYNDALADLPDGHARLLHFLSGARASWGSVPQ